MSRHTVGPWEYDPESGDIIAPKCGYQWQKGAPVIATIGHLDYAEDDANARLIAAAPALLEALGNIVDCCNEDHAARDYASRQYEIRGIARNAIAAAKGEA